MAAHEANAKQLMEQAQAVGSEVGSDLRVNC